MRVVHLSYYFTTKGRGGGAAVAASRLHLEMMNAGIDSHFICVESEENCRNVHRVPSSWLLQKCFYLIVRFLWIVSRILFGKIYMLNLIPLPGLVRAVKLIDPDVVHFHGIYQDMFSFLQAARLNVPVVISLHDFLPINAFDSQPADDVRFVSGFNHNNSSWIERLAFNRKLDLVKSIKPVFICPSKWVLRKVRNAIALSGRPLCVVGNVIDSCFKFDPVELVPHQKFTILFGAAGGRALPIKGWEILMEAIRMLPLEHRANIEVLVFGESSGDYVDESVSVRFCGSNLSPVELRTVHHRADVFAFPSLAETQGMAKFEAMCDGLPVLVFNRAACAEGVVHQNNGWVSPDGDVSHYSEGIKYYYRKFKDGTLNSCRATIAINARERCAADQIVKSVLGVYADIA